MTPLEIIRYIDLRAVEAGISAGIALRQDRVVHAAVHDVESKCLANLADELRRKCQTEQEQQP